MQEIVKREDQELIQIVREAVVRMWGIGGTPAVCAALNELERRHCNKGSVLARIARVEEDLAAFKRAHVHPVQWNNRLTYTKEPCAGEVLGQGGLSHVQARCAHNTVSKLSGRCTKCNLFMGIHVPIAEQITDLRANAENRAWQCFEDWRELEIKKPENAGNVYEVVIVPPSHGLQYAAEIWACSIRDGRTLRDLIVSKEGTSRVDALAHLASWCQAEMPLPGTCTCGTVASVCHSGMCSKCGKEAL